jgi:hypothetical protein
MGDYEKGERLHQLAEEIRQEIQGDTYGEYGDDDRSYDMLVSFFHR